MNTYYLKKFRKKAKEFHRIQLCKGEYIVQRKVNIGISHNVWHWEKVEFYNKTLEGARRDRINAERTFVIMEVEKMKNKLLARL
jgi:hypothetical protein